MLLWINKLNDKWEDFEFIDASNSCTFICLFWPWSSSGKTQAPCPQGRSHLPCRTDRVWRQCKLQEDRKTKSNQNFAVMVETKTKNIMYKSRILRLLLLGAIHREILNKAKWIGKFNRTFTSQMVTLWPGSDFHSFKKERKKNVTLTHQAVFPVETAPPKECWFLLSFYAHHTSSGFSWISSCWEPLLPQESTVQNILLGRL